MELPTEWTYGGLLDWSSKDKLRLAPAGLALRCIRCALNERLGLDYDHYTLTPLNSIYSAVSSIASDMQSALYYYWYEEKRIAWADYRTRSSWAGATDISNVAPRFTDAALLDAIGDEALIAAPGRLSPLTVDWIYQQYKLLNAMRYGDLEKDQSINAYVVSGSGSSWTEAVNDYSTGEDFSTSGTLIYSAADSGGYSLARGGFNYEALGYHLSTAYVEWYFKAVASHPTGVFNAQGFNVAEGVFSLIHTAEKGVASFTIQDPFRENPPPGRPASGSAGWRLQEPWWAPNDYKPVATFDFMFKNW